MAKKVSKHVVKRVVKPAKVAKPKVKAQKKASKKVTTTKSATKSAKPVGATKVDAKPSSSSNSDMQQATFTNSMQSNKIVDGWNKLLGELAGNPDLLAEALKRQSASQQALMAELAEGMSDFAQQDGQVEQSVDKKHPDPRFADPLWDSHPFYRYLRGSYEAFSETVRSLPQEVELDDTQRRAVNFVIEQMVSAMAPSNFAPVNPEVINATIDSGGKNLQLGLANYLHDVQEGAITNTDRKAFTVGKDLAITPGKVVWCNGLIELIEYKPTTDSVNEEPLLVVPPCINKYYILDLRPKNSLIKHLVDSGKRVFLVSWVNARDEHDELGWDDYVEDGVIGAINAVREITDKKIHTLGYCIGGTLLACAASVLKQRRQNLITSMSMLTSFLDFCDTGDVGLFVDEQMVEKCETKYVEGGLFSGRDLANTFAYVRPNELVWPYVVRNYMLGEKPKAFDILFWNSDSTNLPGAMYAWYLRHTYLNNDLKTGKVTICGKKVNFADIKLPGVVVTCERDHIVPWKAGYHSAQLLGEKVKFILASSGHVAGIVNPPSSGKGYHITQNNSGKLPADPDRWFATGKKTEGGWWDTYVQWLDLQCPRKIKAPTKLGNNRYRPMYDAPGNYLVEPLQKVNSF